MTLLLPVIPRFLLCRPQTAFRNYRELDKFAVKLSRQCTRSYFADMKSYPQCSHICSRQRLNTLHNRETSSLLIKATRNYSTNKSVIIKNFNDLPRDYKDSKGLPYRHQNLTLAETQAIFGNVIDTGTADRVLRGLHGRRVAGTLEDPLYSNVFEKDIVDKALTWLRKNVPVDEDMNAGLRAEKELAEIEDELVYDAEKIGLYKPNSVTPKNVYGTSEFDKIRESNISKRKMEEATRNKSVQELEIIQNNGKLEIPKSKVKLDRPGEHPWLKYYRERANVLPDKPPVMTTWQRLWPSGLVVLGVFILSIVFTEVYTPPKKSARLFPNMPVSAATVIGIIIANSTIFCMWRVPMFWRFLNKYFITYPGYPRPLSLLGCFWSHQNVSHLAINMTLLYIIGTRLHEDIGRANFLALYFSSGTMSGFFSLACWVFMKNFSSSSIGASGAVIAVITAFLLCHSSEKIKFFDTFPPNNWPSITALLIFGFLFSCDLIALRRFHKTGTGLTVDHYGHIGGYTTGAIWAYFLH